MIGKRAMQHAARLQHCTCCSCAASALRLQNAQQCKWVKKLGPQVACRQSCLLPCRSDEGHKGRRRLTSKGEELLRRLRFRWAAHMSMYLDALKSFHLCQGMVCCVPAVVAICVYWHGLVTLSVAQHNAVGLTWMHALCCQFSSSAFPFLMPYAVKVSSSQISQCRHATLCHISSAKCQGWPSYAGINSTKAVTVATFCDLESCCGAFVINQPETSAS